MKSLSPIETEDLYKNLFEKNPSVMLIFERETYKILDVNEAALQTYGYSREEFLSMTIKDLRPREEWSKMEAAAKALLTDFKTGIWKHIKKSGELITVSIRAVVINYMGKEAVLSIPQDITERVKKEEEINKLNANLILLNENLKNNEVRLRASQEAAKIGYWEYFFNEELYYISDELYRIFDIEFTPGPVKREVLTPRVHPDDLHIVRNAVEQGKLYGKFTDYTYRLKEKNGSIKYIYTKGEVKKDKNGKAEKIIGISMDVTEQEEARTQLQQHTNNINLILRSISDIFYIVDKNYSILFANKAVETLSGLSNEELAGKNVWKVFEDAELHLPKKHFEKAMKENKASEFEMEYHGRIFRVFLYPSEIGLAVTGRDVTEHVKIQNELSVQVNNINIILKSISAPFFILDKNYNFIFANDSLLKLTESTLEDLQKNNLWSVFIRENQDFTNLRRALETSLKKKVSSEVEFTFNEKTFYARIYASEIGLAVSCSDITEKKKAEEELRSNTKFLKEISDTIPGVIFQTEYDKNSNTRFNYISEKAETYTGYTAKELMTDYNKHLNSIHKDDLKHFNDMRFDLSNMNSFSIKYRYINNKTQETKWVRVTVVSSRLSNGNIIRNGILLDISESENYYEQLEKSNQRYEYISRATNEAIWEMGVYDTVVKFGGSYKDIFGNEYEDEIPYEEWKSLVHPDDINEIVKLADSVSYEQRGNHWEAEYRLMRKDGKVLNILEKAYMVYDKTGKIPIRTIGTMQNVTHIKKIQAEKEKMVLDLIKRNEALEQFTYMVSHNIRAPLANVMGLSLMLDDETLDTESKDEINKMIVTSSHRLDEVVKDINDILDSNKKFDEDRAEVVFESVLSEVKSIEGEGIQKAQIKVVSDFENAKSIFAVRSSIQSIFQNLISNSIKFKREKSAKIKILSEEDGEFIYLSFEDNGIGFDSVKNIEKIFGLYNRFHLEKEGKGIGLFMVKTQVESMGGEIFVESEINKGTKFLIKFRKSHL